MHRKMAHGSKHRCMHRRPKGTPTREPRRRREARRVADGGQPRAATSHDADEKPAASPTEGSQASSVGGRSAPLGTCMQDASLTKMTNAALEP